MNRMLWAWAPEILQEARALWAGSQRMSLSLTGEEGFRGILAWEKSTWKSPEEWKYIALLRELKLVQNDGNTKWVEVRSQRLLRPQARDGLYRRALNAMKRAQEKDEAHMVSFPAPPEIINGPLKCGWPERTSKVIWFNSQVKKRASSMRSSWKMAGWTETRTPYSFLPRQAVSSETSVKPLGLSNTYNVQTQRWHVQHWPSGRPGLRGGEWACWLSHSSIVTRPDITSPLLLSPQKLFQSKFLITLATCQDKGHHRCQHRVSWRDKRSPQGILGNLQPHTGAPT